MKTDRIRIEIWASVKPVIDSQMLATGLTATEVINISLIQFFGLSPKGSFQKNTPAYVTEEIPEIVYQQTDDEDELGL